LGSAIWSEWKACWSTSGTEKKAMCGKAPCPMPTNHPKSCLLPESGLKKLES